jgi:hypothetical protein
MGINLVNIVGARRVSRWFKARSVNQTSNGYVDKLPTLTEPYAGDKGTATGASVIDVSGSEIDNNPSGGSISVPEKMVIMPYGIGADTNTFSLRVIGWIPLDRTVSPQGSNVVWIPQVLAEFVATISSSLPGPGVDLLSTEYLANTLTLVSGYNTTDNLTNNPALTKVPAFATVDLKGITKLEFSFTTGASATSCNCLYRFI